jgi:HAD superfamily hydrolase (TIGR01490 family)
MLNINTNHQMSYAFFDVDETIISIKSMFSFINLYFTQYPNHALQQAFTEEMQTLLANTQNRHIANKRYYEYFKHFPINKVKTVCDLWFKKHAANNAEFYHRNVVQQLKHHQNNGTECVFVSGSFKELLQPIADELGVNYMLCTRLLRTEFGYTGEIGHPQTIGAGKAEAIRLFLKANNGDARSCFAYGDDISDVHMLELVGHPRVVSGEKSLEKYAQTINWQIIMPNPA